MPKSAALPSRNDILRLLGVDGKQTDAHLELFAVELADHHANERLGGAMTVVVLRNALGAMLERESYGRPQAEHPLSARLPDFIQVLVSDEEVKQDALTFLEKRR